MALVAVLIGLFAALAGAPEAAAKMSQYEFGFDRPGQDYHHFSANGWQTCSTSCATNDQCRAYTFVKPSASGANGTCWLKSKVPSRKANGCCVSGVKIMSPDEINVDRPGKDIKPGYPVNLPTVCERDCQLNGKCQAWTFVKPGYQGNQAKCWLKSARPAAVNNDCCISGYRMIQSAPVRKGPKSMQLMK
jgi:hypothetical protein